MNKFTIPDSVDINSLEEALGEFPYKKKPKLSYSQTRDLRNALNPTQPKSLSTKSATQLHTQYQDYQEVGNIDIKLSALQDLISKRDQNQTSPTQQPHNLKPPRAPVQLDSGINPSQVTNLLDEMAKGGVNKKAKKSSPGEAQNSKPKNTMKIIDQDEDSEEVSQTHQQLTIRQSKKEQNSNYKGEVDTPHTESSEEGTPPADARDEEPARNKTEDLKSSIAEDLGFAMEDMVITEDESKLEKTNPNLDTTDEDNDTRLDQGRMAMLAASLLSEMSQIGDTDAAQKAGGRETQNATSPKSNDANTNHTSKSLKSIASNLLEKLPILGNPTNKMTVAEALERDRKELTLPSLSTNPSSKPPLPKSKREITDEQLREAILKSMDDEEGFLAILTDLLHDRLSEKLCDNRFKALEKTIAKLTQENTNLKNQIYQNNLYYKKEFEDMKKNVTIMTEQVDILYNHITTKSIESILPPISPTGLPKLKQFEPLNKQEPHSVRVTEIRKTIRHPSGQIIRGISLQERLRQEHTIRHPQQKLPGHFPTPDPPQKRKMETQPTRMTLQEKLIMNKEAAKFKTRRTEPSPSPEQAVSENNYSTLLSHNPRLEDEDILEDHTTIGEEISTNPEVTQLNDFLISLVADVSVETLGGRAKFDETSCKKALRKRITNSRYKEILDTEENYSKLIAAVQTLRANP